MNTVSTDCRSLRTVHTMGTMISTSTRRRKPWTSTFVGFNIEMSFASRSSVKTQLKPETILAVNNQQNSMKFYS